ncbi:MAG TPA: hypothetical protein VF789_12970 [Thermoanaerobaculia bacterium]
MKLPKFARFAALSLILAATALPASAARRCSCDYCQTVPSETPCVDPGSGATTCGTWLAVTLCPPVG